MGCGTWDRKSFATYSVATKGVSLDASGAISADLSNQEMFKERRLNKDLNPFNVTRECRDSEEHPNTVPVILALDVTGSMGQAAVEVAKKLNVIMTNLYEKIADVEFMIMGIGDFYCDGAPLQVSQFESDIRIAEQLDKVFFEFGGGGNFFESYTSAWYFGLRHCVLDCWNRGKKGIIITMGDERLNPYIPKSGMKVSIESYIGDTIEADIDTKQLFEEASKKYDIYHLNVIHNHSDYDKENIIKSWVDVLEYNHFRDVTLDNITNEIVNIIEESVNGNGSGNVSTVADSDGISW